MAYRAGERLVNERDGQVHDFTRKQGVEHAEIVLPEAMREGRDGERAAGGPGDGSPDWARDRARLWNAAEAAEKRKDARVGREFEIGLPHEMTAEQRLEAVRDFARGLADRYGAAVDFAIHAPHEAGDIRNHHAHVMMSTRQIGPEGFGEKTYLERENRWLVAEGLPTTDLQLRDLRQAWEGIANAHLAQAGLDLRIDHRSHIDRGLELAPTEHMGVHATQMERSGVDVGRARLDEAAARRNADLIREEPEQILQLIIGEKSVFDRRDVARALHRALDGGADVFQMALAKVMGSQALVELQAERVDPHSGEVIPARYSTREMIGVEHDMIAAAQRLGEDHGHGVRAARVERAIARQDAALQCGSGDASARLSDEQRGAIRHITGAARASVVVGFAGAGKSTMLAAAREAWEAEGYSVHGAALSGKAAEGLEESSGIRSRTLASWARGWETGRNQISWGDVFVIDEAGMIGSRQMAGFVAAVEARGAKIVLVGDHEQLQAIGAGAPFRAISEAVGHAELSEIRRQRQDWQRAASVDFAIHRTAEALAAYRDHGDIRFSETGAGARGEIVKDYLADLDARPEGTRVAMAHRRVDVRALNAEIRTALQGRGDLARGAEAGELEFRTHDGLRHFAPGDRIVFLENNRDLGVKNGMLAVVERVDEGRLLARLDGAPGAEGRSVSVSMEDYGAVDHGYATTIHKNQGATVDRAFVLGSGTMDRHLTYVAMTRHRDGAQLYAGMDEFGQDRGVGHSGGHGAGRDGVVTGRLVAHGVAPYQHRPGAGQSYFVTLEGEAGRQHTVWGVDLERGIVGAAPQIGDRIGLRHEGREAVRLSSGREVERHIWSVQDACALAYRQLEARLSRSGAKETTLDYPDALAARDFAGRRGIAEGFGIRSEIEVPHEGVRDLVGREETGRGLRHGRELDGRRSGAPASVRSASERPEREKGAGVSVGGRAAGEPSPGEGAAAAKPAPRRSMFSGLKLSRGTAEGRTPDRASALDAAQASGRQVSDRLAERFRPMTPFATAVDHYAKAYASAHRQLEAKLPLLDMQKRDFIEAGAGLDQLRPGTQDLMRSALKHDPEMHHDLTERSGRDRVRQVIEGLRHEQALQRDPQVRADRLLDELKEMQAQRDRLQGWQQAAERGKVEAGMKDLLKGLERDPQVDSLLRERVRELGINGPVRQGDSLSHAMERSFERGRGHGLER